MQAPSVPSAPPAPPQAAPPQAVLRPTTIRVSFEQALLATIIIAAGVLSGLVAFVVFVHWFGLEWIQNL